jgi:isopentenyl-diphosphate delta-isomerase
MSHPICAQVDYILFIKAPVDVTPNPEEVAATKYVSLEQLRSMMDPQSGLKWSPWFRIIMERFLERWWAELDVTLTTDTHVDVASIHHVL